MCVCVCVCVCVYILMHKVCESVCVSECVQVCMCTARSVDTSLYREPQMLRLELLLKPLNQKIISHCSSGVLKHTTVSTRGWNR